MSTSKRSEVAYDFRFINSIPVIQYMNYWLKGKTEWESECVCVCVCVCVGGGYLLSDSTMRIGAAKNNSNVLIVEKNLGKTWSELCQESFSICKCCWNAYCLQILYEN
jgi:hypothetical protein